MLGKMRKLAASKISDVIEANKTSDPVASVASEKEVGGSPFTPAGADVLARSAPVERTFLKETHRASDRIYDGMKKGGKVTASKRADGIAKRGKTRGTMISMSGKKAKK